MLATIEKLGLTTEQLGEAYSSDDYATLQQVLNKLDKKTLVELTSKLAVYSMATMIQLSNELKILLDKNNELATIGRRGIENMSDMRDIEKNGEKIHKSKQAKRGGEAKRNNDPKQQAKSEIKRKWEVWRNDPKNVGIKDAIFVKDMESRYCDDKNPTALQSRAVIERWVRVWKKEQNTTQPT
jgi:hypothetical protein